MTNEQLVLDLVQRTTRAASGYAMVKVGKYVEVRADLQCSSNCNQLVEVSWPSIGSVDAEKTASFARDLLQAAEVAKEAETQLRAFLPKKAGNASNFVERGSECDIYNR
jgi:hypothetical protein